MTENDKLSRMVEIVAKRAAKRTPSHITFDDLLSVGWIGLLEAQKRFDPSKGIALKSFAEHRVKGAIMDYLRGEDWTPRSLRDKEKKISATIAKLEAENGEKPSVEDIAASLGWTLEEVQSGGAASLQSLDSVATAEGEGTLHDTVAGPRLGYNPEARDQVNVAFGALSPSEREVIQRVYFMDEKARSAADAIGVTEGRVSQVRKSAIEKMRVRLAA